MKSIVEGNFQKIKRMWWLEEIIKLALQNYQYWYWYYYIVITRVK